MIGILLWLGWAYAQNLPGQFYFGLVLAVAALVGCRVWFRPGGLAIQGLNSLMLVCLALPLADLLVGSPKSPPKGDEVAGVDYSFEAAKGDPHRFNAWRKRFLTQCSRVETDCFEPDPNRVLPYRMRPNSQSGFFQSRFRINSRGFRGQELARNKGNTYRIVALGESTTFGIGLTADYRPWPELLEEMIRERLKPSRPVEVVNAGIIRFNLEDTLHRLGPEILPLAPDLLISYHGWNGFHFFSAALPPVFGKHLPIYKPRPIRLLAECEYRLKMLASKRRLMTKSALNPPPVSDLMATPYARAYEQLVQISQTNNLRLVLANYSMAVNAQSPAEVVDFYREAFPALYWQIQANQMHSRLVEEVARRNSSICLVDTHPHLDGRHELFIDPMHFTQEGDRLMAETMFEGIRKILQEDLGTAGTDR